MKRIISLRCSSKLHNPLQVFASYSLLVAFFAMICAVNVVAADEQEEDQDEQKIEKRVEIHVEVDDEGKVNITGTEDGEKMDLSGVSNAIKKAIKLGLPNIDGEIGEIQVQIRGDGGVELPGLVLKMLGKDGLHAKQGNRMLFLRKGDGEDAEVFEWHGKDGDKNVWVFEGEDGHEVKPFGLTPPGAARYRLGVALEPVSAVLRAHLGIDEEVGLMVRQVIDDSPAEEIGLRRFDVLIAAGGDDISSTDQSSLVAAIEAAGDAGKQLAITYMRECKRKRARFTPQKVESDDGDDDDGDDDDGDDDDGDDDDGDDDDGDDEDGDDDEDDAADQIRERIERARSDAARAVERARRQRQRGRSSDSVDDLRKEVQDLKEAIEEIRKALGDDD